MITPQNASAVFRQHNKNTYPESDHVGAALVNIFYSALSQCVIEGKVIQI